MPEKETMQRARRAKREGKRPTTQAGPFVREEVEHVRRGTHGARSTKQAIAIGLSKARRAGARGRDGRHERRGDAGPRAARRGPIHRPRGEAPRADPSAEDVARAIVELAERPRAERFVGNGARLVAALHAIAPAAPTPGNVLAPLASWTGTSGGWRRRRQRPRLALPVIAVVSALAVWLARPGRRARRERAA